MKGQLGLPSSQSHILTLSVSAQSYGPEIMAQRSELLTPPELTAANQEVTSQVIDRAIKIKIKIDCIQHCWQSPSYCSCRIQDGIIKQWSLVK